jgi:hypothetical protein
MTNIKHVLYRNQWRREGVKAGGGGLVKMKERPKMFAPSDVHYFFRKFSIFCPNFQTRYRMETFFSALYPGFSGFQEDFPVNFAPK